MQISSLRYDNSRRRTWSPRKCDKYSKSKNSDLCSFSAWDAGLNMLSRGMSKQMEKYIALFCYCYQLLIVSAPQPASITIKAATDFSNSE